MFDVLAEHFGLEPTDHGRAFKTHGETFRIAAINLSRPEYSISLEHVADGRGFKGSAEAVVLYLRKDLGRNILSTFP